MLCPRAEAGVSRACEAIVQLWTLWLLVGELLCAWGGREEEGLDCLVSGVQWKCHNEQPSRLLQFAEHITEDEADDLIDVFC